MIIFFLDLNPVLSCWLCVNMRFCVLIGNLSLNLDFSVFEALQQAHLLERLGHSRQPSDSSIDKFVSRDEATEPGDQENKVRRLGMRLLSILSLYECLKSLRLLSVCHASSFPISKLFLSSFPLNIDLFPGLLFSASPGTTQSLKNCLKFCLPWESFPDKSVLTDCYLTWFLGPFVWWLCMALQHFLFLFHWIN